jgi:hypothetical protein
MTPLILVTVIVILVATPLSVLAAAFCWQLYREERDGLRLVLALMVTAATLAGTLLAIPTVAFIAGVQLPFGGQLVLVAIDILLPSAVGFPAYLRWLRGRA